MKCKSDFIYTWYDIAQYLHAANPNYRYWITIDPPLPIDNINRSYMVDKYDKVPCIMIQVGRKNIFGTGEIDVNYVNPSFIDNPH